MGMHIRKVKNASGNTCVQVVSYINRANKIEKHLGTAKNEEDLKKLISEAETFIKAKNGLQPLFADRNPEDYLSQVFLGRVYHNYAYEFYIKCYTLIGFNKLESMLIRDLSIIRIIEPSSKIRATELLQEYFNINYSKNYLYRELPKVLDCKATCEQIAIDFAKKTFSFDFTMVFYDVTTLYFESFKEDNLKKCGFSKDNKFNQPQVVIALIVDQHGYPISYEVFEGNKFEGHTILPVITGFKKKYNIEKLTIVADAAMLSKANLKEFQENNLHYLVGARLGNLSAELIKELSDNLNRTEGKIFKKDIDDHFLICDFSKKRASKDKSDREKQIARANSLLANPSRAVKRAKFLKSTAANKLELNTDLIPKAELLEGIKGYVTNVTDLTSEQLISKYKDLWKIEKAFRIAKHDLEIRPIYLWREVGIKSHLVIVFISLCISKFLELKSSLSIAKINKLLWQVHDGEIIDRSTGKQIISRTPLPEKLIELEQILSH